MPMQAPVGTIMLAGDPYQPLQQSYGHPAQVHMVSGALGPRQRMNTSTPQQLRSSQLMPQNLSYGFQDYNERASYYNNNN